MLIFDDVICTYLLINIYSGKTQKEWTKEHGLGAETADRTKERGLEEETADRISRIVWIKERGLGAETADRI